MVKFPRVGLVVVLLFLPAWLGFGAATTAPAGAPPSWNARVVAEARRILGNVKTTQYQHKTQIDETHGAYALDCSGLVCRILQKAAPHQLAAIAIEDHHSRQRAWEFYESFKKAGTTAVPGWKAIGRMLDAQPGDVLARRAKDILPGESTGHVMIIDATPVEEAPGRIRVVVIDSTSRPHANDTRPAGTNGVGRGTIWVEVDAQGQPVGVRAKADGKGPRMALAIGRVEELPQ